MAGLHVEPLGESRRRELGVSKKVRGLFVVEVVRGSSMDRAGVKPRDILVQVNGRAMASQQDLRLVEGAVRSNRALELLLVREGQMIFVEVKNERG
ncbi:PDZ domain-containing protein [bacterium]|nr:PDZ domain-containing protein [bacterium]